MRARSFDGIVPPGALLTILAREHDRPPAPRVYEIVQTGANLSASLELPRDVIAKTLLALSDADVVPASEHATTYVSAIDSALEDNVMRYMRAIEEPIERRVIAPLAMEELVFRLLRTGAAAVLRGVVAQVRHVDAVQQAMHFMRLRVTHPLSVEDVARHVGMSASHFAHRFRAVARISPMRYLKQLRLQDARALLLANRLRVSEVAVRVGYESASHFTRDFKSCFGATPAEYVRRFKDAGSGEGCAVSGIAPGLASA
jgi:AraC-like DNA-binding protein